MNTESQERLLRALYACIRPLARLLLRSGVTYKTFGEVAKAAFVHEALLERDSKGRLTNASRVAVRTGLSRKEVRRITADAGDSIGGDTVRIGHFGAPARVLDAWHADSRFVDAEGAAKDLPFEGADCSFIDVVRAAGGDVPPGAVRAELLRAAAIVELANGHLRPTKRYFVPGDFDEKAIAILSGIAFPMLAGIDHNANPHRTSAGFIQRFAFASLPEGQRPVFRDWARDESTRFVEMINDRLNKDRIPMEEAGDNDVISGVGVFFYEGALAESLPKPDIES